MQNQWNTCFPQSPKPPPTPFSYLRQIVVFFLYLTAKWCHSYNEMDAQAHTALVFVILMKIIKYLLTAM